MYQKILKNSLNILYRLQGGNKENIYTDTVKKYNIEL